MRPDKPTVLIVEDNVDDRYLLHRAFTGAGLSFSFQMAEDGEEAIQYMMGEGKFADRKAYPYPSFITTDLKMPRKDGLAVLAFLKKNPDWAIIPTVVLSGSKDEDDIKKSYMLGASSYHVKPATAEGLRELIKSLLVYWSACEVPAVSVEGCHLPTDGKDKLGEGYLENPTKPISR